MKKVLSIFLAVLMLTSVMALAAVPANAAKVGDLIQFGSYPQSQVDETAALKSAANAATWKSYGYYSGTGSIDSIDGKMHAGDWMKFADFFSGGVKYRAVKFTQYRPCCTNYETDAFYSYQDDNNYWVNTTYYFKFEPLTWRVLDPAKGFVLSDVVIDAQAYQNVVFYNKAGYEFYQGINSNRFASDYSTSSIRAWLNNDFYNTAFTSGQKAKIKTTALSVEEYSAVYGQHNVAPLNDKIFLLSYEESYAAAYGLSNRDDRIARCTSYARCQGLLSTYNGAARWWTRTASGSLYARAVIDYGEDVHSTGCGVRPACCLTGLTSDPAVSDTLYSGGETETPGTPDSPTTQTPSGVCPWCGGEHSADFFQMFIGWIHGILAAIFGAKY